MTRTRVCSSSDKLSQYDVHFVRDVFLQCYCDVLLRRVTTKHHFTFRERSTRICVTTIINISFNYIARVPRTQLLSKEFSF